MGPGFRQTILVRFSCHHRRLALEMAPTRAKVRRPRDNSSVAGGTINTKCHIIVYAWAWNASLAGGSESWRRTQHSTGKAVSIGELIFSHENGHLTKRDFIKLAFEKKNPLAFSSWVFNSRNMRCLFYNGYFLPRNGGDNGRSEKAAHWLLLSRFVRGKTLERPYSIIYTGTTLHAFFWKLLICFFLNLRW